LKADNARNVFTAFRDVRSRAGLVPERLPWPPFRPRAPQAPSTRQSGEGRAGDDLQNIACRTTIDAPAMFAVTERDATAIRTAFDQGGELSATVELRRLFPGIIDSDQAPAFARTIAGWKPRPMKSRRAASSARPAARAAK
jgi:hypothetical protein